MHDHAPPQLTRREILATAVTLGTAAFAPAGAQPLELPTSSKELWQWVRTQPVADARIAWFDVASSGATLRGAMASEYRAREIQSIELASFANTDRWSVESTRLAMRFATFVGCDPDEVLFTHGTGEGLSMVAAGLDLNSGDEILTTAQEHPAAISPWMFQARRRGIVVKQIQLPMPLTSTAQVLEAFTQAITERTKVLAFSHVQYADGFVMPVRDLCQLARQRNIISVVDGAQALGMLNFFVRDLGCDFYAAGFHKWLAGCHGTGLLYIRREMLDRLWPQQARSIDASPPLATPTYPVGQNAIPAALHKFGNVLPQLWPALRGSEAALEFHDQINRTRIEARIRELVIYARMRLQQLPGIEMLTAGAPGLWGGILTFRAPGRPASAQAATLAGVNRTYLSSLNWPNAEQGSMRLSLHIFNTHDEVDRLVTGLSLIPKP